MISLAENNGKQVEAAWSEQNLLLNSFRSAMIDLKQCEKYLAEIRWPQWKTKSIQVDLYWRILLLKISPRHLHRKNSSSVHDGSGWVAGMVLPSSRSFPSWIEVVLDCDNILPSLIYLQPGLLICSGLSNNLILIIIKFLSFQQSLKWN